MRKIKEENYRLLTNPYKDALSNLKNRIEILNQDYFRKNETFLIHNIQCRVKSMESTITKLKKDNLEITIENAKNELLDIAGIRLICYFTEDVYKVVDLLKNFQDIIVIKEKDYIKNPKDRGYKSYHIILGVPIYYVDGKQIYPVEIQIRTMAMDFWASMDHRINYKNDEPKEYVVNKMYQYSKLLDDIERKMTEFCQINKTN